MRASLISAEPQTGGRVLLKLQCTLEIEGEAKPALVAEILCMLIGKPDARHDEQFSAWRRKHVACADAL